MNKDSKILVEIYKELSANRRHYDNICWSIGGVVLPIVLTALGFAYIHRDIALLLCLLSILLLVFWNVIYDRLGFHASVLKKRMKAIEDKIIGKLKNEPYKFRFGVKFWRWTTTVLIWFGIGIYFILLNK